ncbi:MAG: hypothetical protein ABSD13_19830, partial [Candidatus Korobacteraceae bacterium]
MQISNISRIAAPAAERTTTSRQLTPDVSSSILESAPEDSFSSSAPVRVSSSPTADTRTALSDTSASSKSARTFSSSEIIQSSASSIQVTVPVASYSTTAGGKNYSESIEESGGTYLASVPNPP